VADRLCNTECLGRISGTRVYFRTGGFPVSNLVSVLVILTEVSLDSPQSLQANARVGPRSSSRPFPFRILYGPNIRRYVVSATDNVVKKP
jgi:uncharacterized lipoprotein YbaY